MMTELKTLKDITMLECPEGDNTQKIHCESNIKEDIRQEAIKRCKYYQKEIINGTADDDYVMAGSIKELNEFCNINDEELKMNELKTLNDLRYTVSLGQGKYVDHPTADELKEEAIKWCKHYIKESYRDYASESIHGLQTLRHFFNITDDDLK
jgi:hypothetical protein